MNANQKLYYVVAAWRDAGDSCFAWQMENGFTKRCEARDDATWMNQDGIPAKVLPVSYDGTSDDFTAQLIAALAALPKRKRNYTW